MKFYITIFGIEDETESLKSEIRKWMIESSATSQSTSSAPSPAPGHFSFHGCLNKTIALAVLCLAEAAGRKKVISSKKSTHGKVDDDGKSSYPKKVISLKKRPTKSSIIVATNSTKQSIDLAKHSKDVVEVFKNLPADDLEFIKELDKQFKLHGDKLKIKVERENTTSSSKNYKRTIDGELGYGYEHNGYTYDKPKFMFYPYSQKDIPSDAPAYYPQYESTSVTIEPSYSYELKPQTYLVQHHASAQPEVDLPRHPNGGPIDYSSEHDGYQEPVIVLRIPGPTKYASHLQTLLQQYLEIRAAQYLKILQETEARKQQQHQHEQYNQDQSHQQQQNQQYNQEYVHQQQQQYYDNEHEQQQPLPEGPAQHIEAPSQDYALNVGYSHQEAPIPQSISYPAIDDVYHAYKERQQYQQVVAPVQHQHQQNIQFTEADAASQYYYPEQQEQTQNHAQSNVEHQQGIYVIAMAPAAYSSDDHNIEQHQYGAPQHQIFAQEDATQYSNQAYQDHEHSGHLATSENSPRPTHTKVVFTQRDESHSNEHASAYPLPSIRPHERHEPAQPIHYHHQYQEYHQQHQQGFQADYQQSPVPESAPHADLPKISQRPFNYHAHSSKVRNRLGRKRAATTSAPAKSASSSEEVDETEQHLQKIRQYVQEKLGARASENIEIRPAKNSKSN